jgi:hypothetical protein
MANNQAIIDKIANLTLDDLTDEQLKSLALDHARAAYSRQIRIYTEKQLERARRKSGSGEKYAFKYGLTRRHNPQSASVQPAH